MTQVIPYLTIDGAAEALDWYAQALGAQERYRLAMPDGRLGHAEMQIGETVLMLSDEWPEGHVLSPTSRGGATTSFSVNVASIDEFDAVWKRAVDAGAKVEREPADQFYGHRTASMIDPFGHRWTVNVQIEDVSPQEMQRRMEAMGG